jgi:hypothetical protein
MRMKSTLNKLHVAPGHGKGSGPPFSPPGADGRPAAETEWSNPPTRAAP